MIWHKVKRETHRVVRKAVQQWEHRQTKRAHMSLPDTAKLFTCNGVKYDGTLLEQHINHYLSLGVAPRNYLLMLNAEHEDDLSLRKAKAVCQSMGVNLVHTWIGEYTSQKMHELRNQLINEHVADDEWIVHADADEFHFYPEPLFDVLKQSKKNGHTAIQGVFTDRIDSNGILKKIQSSIPVYQQFPTLANLNDLWFNRHEAPATGVVKMMAYRKGMTTSQGGHIIAQSETLPVDYAYGSDLSQHPEIFKTSFREGCPFQVHHFKWHSNVIEKLRRRVQTYKARGMDWWTSSQKFIDFCNGGDQIPMELIELYDDQTAFQPRSHAEFKQQAS